MPATVNRKAASGAHWAETESVVNAAKYWSGA